MTWCRECWFTVCRCPLKAWCRACEMEYTTTYLEWADCPTCGHDCNPVILPDEGEPRATVH